jgi:hypothetical protein
MIIRQEIEVGELDKVRRSQQIQKILANKTRPKYIISGDV